MVYLQQDAFDPVDVSVSLERQKELFALVRELVQRDYPFDGKDEARSSFTQLTGLLKNLNYAARDSQEYTAYREQIAELVQTLGRTPVAVTTAEPEPAGASSAPSAATSGATVEG